jgi:hypothetical protein
MSRSPAPERHAAGCDAKTRVPAPSRPRSESRQRTALVAVRLLPQERDMLAETARSRGITLSELIRASAMSAAGAPAAEAGTRLPSPGLVPRAASLRLTSAMSNSSESRVLLGPILGRRVALYPAQTG